MFKCANNQIRAMLKQINNHTGSNFVQLKHQTLVKHLEHYPKRLPAPCIFTAIRDPISHFLSGYNEIEYRFEPYYNHTKGRMPPFGKLPRETADERRIRFQTFVEELLLGQYQYQIGLYWHVFSMSRILGFLQKHNATLTGYLPQLSNLTSTLPVFLSETCPNMYPVENMTAAVKTAGQHNSSQDPLGTYQAAKDVWMEAGPTARALCLLHAFDYACYPDLPDGIPPLCQYMYEKHAEEIIRVGIAESLTNATGSRVRF